MHDDVFYCGGERVTLPILAVVKAESLDHLEYMAREIQIS